jgi:hypothetical protein
LLSCFPKIDGSGDATYRLFVPGDGWRETVDPDDFTSGFAIWSGTSFAAPIFAGEVAAELLTRGTDRLSREKMVERCTEAVQARVKAVKPKAQAVS